jgi:hypothetical protein
MHVDADIIKVPDNHLYEESLTSTNSFAGYDCQADFWKCWFIKANRDSTDMAHNGAGYDNKFVLNLCIDHGLHAAMLIRQGSRITYMHFNNTIIMLTDTLLCSMKA